VGRRGDGGKVGKWWRGSRRSFPSTMDAQASSRLLARTSMVSATARTRMRPTVPQMNSTALDSLSTPGETMGARLDALELDMQRD
jgi:hypothetical protein